MKLKTLCLLASLFSFTASADIYWTESGDGEIKRSANDGSNITDIHTNLSRPSGIAIDEINQRLYWTDRGNGTINSSDLDGSNPSTLVSTNLYDTFGIALDVANNKMYWAEAQLGKIQRANLDGSNVEDIVTGLSAPEALTLDLTHGFIYFTDYVTQKVQRSKLDGSELTTLHTFQNFAGLEGIALDSRSQTLYFAARSDGKIYSLAADGTNLTTVLSGLNLPIGVAISEGENKLYWVDDGNNTVNRADLDGSTTEQLHTTSTPKGIVFTDISSPPIHPTISFSSESITITEGQSIYVPFTLRGSTTNNTDVYLNYSYNSNEAGFTGPGLHTLQAGIQYDGIFIQAPDDNSINTIRSGSVKISIPIHESEDLKLGNIPSLEVTVLDNDLPATAYLSSSSNILQEGQQLPITVRRFLNDPGSLTVQIFTTPFESNEYPAATPGAHYENISTTLQFAEGEYEKVLNLHSISSHTASPGTHSLKVIVESPNQSPHHPSSIEILVNDKDDPGSLSRQLSIPDASFIHQIDEVAISSSNRAFALARYKYPHSDKILTFDTQGNSSTFAPINGHPCTRISFDNKGRIYVFYRDIYRYLPDGSLDTSFISPFTYPSAYIYDIAHLPNNQLLVSGNFTVGDELNSREHIVRLHENGSIDLAFDAGIVETSNGVRSIAIAPQGGLVIAGSISSIQGQYQNGVFKLHNNGQLDTSFNPTTSIEDHTNLPYISVSYVTFGPDNLLYCLTGGGKLLKLNNEGLLHSPPLINRHKLTIQPDGKLIHFSQSNVVRSHPDGTLDTSFETLSTSGNIRHYPTISPDGHIYLSGTINKIDGFETPMIAALRGGSGAASGLIELTDTTIDIGEGIGTGNIKLSRSIAADGDIGLLFSFTPNSATSNSDYVATMGYHTFYSGATESSIPFSIIDDYIVESEESFQLEIYNPIGASTLGSNRVATINIIDDDGNGIDAWQARHFPTSPSDESTLTEDPDEDGDQTFVEWMTNSDPSSSQEIKRPSVGTTKVSKVDYLTVSFYHDSTKTDYHVIVESSKDMQTWTPVWINSNDSTLTSELIISKPASDAGWVTVRDNQALEDCGFIRVKYSDTLPNQPNNGGGAEDDEDTGGGNFPKNK